MVDVSVNQAVPDLLVEVTPGSHVSHQGKVYYGTGYPLAPEGAIRGPFLLDGPTALVLIDAGIVRLVDE